MKDEKKRVKEAKRAWKEIGKAIEVERDKIKATLENAESEALQKYQKDTAPFMKTYRIATSKAMRKAQDDSIKLGVMVNVTEREVYKKLLNAQEALRRSLTE